MKAPPQLPFTTLQRPSSGDHKVIGSGRGMSRVLVGVGALEWVSKCRPTLNTCFRFKLVLATAPQKEFPKNFKGLRLAQMEFLSNKHPKTVPPKFKDMRRKCRVPDLGREAAKCKEAGRSLHIIFHTAVPYS